MEWFLYDRDLRHQRVKKELTIGQRERERQSKMHVAVPVPVLDLKAYDATTRTARKKWRELSQN